MKWTNSALAAGLLGAFAIPCAAAPEQVRPSDRLKTITKESGSSAVLSTPPAHPAALIDPLAELAGIWPKITLSTDGRTIHVIGPLTTSSYLRFAQVVRTSPNAKFVYLGSTGGSILQGRLMASLVRMRGLSTYVEHVCASSCTQVFVAGKERVIGARARLGFHQSYSVTEGGSFTRDGETSTAGHPALARTSVVGVTGDQTMRLAYDQAGIASSFVDKVLATPPEGMWFPTLAELAEAHVYSRLTETPELPPPPIHGQKREETVAALRALPLWDAFHAAAPERFDEAADDVWRAINSGTQLGLAQWEARVQIVGYATKQLKFAPDDLLERFLFLYRDANRRERDENFPGCRKIFVTVPQLPNETVLGEAASEDLLMAELLNGAGKVVPLDPEKATRQFRGMAGKIARAGSFAGEVSQTDEERCRFGLKIVEAISNLDPRDRAKAFRAFVSLPPDEAQASGS